MILVLDNYDSFVHNLARYFRRLGQQTQVVRSDAIRVTDVLALKPEAIVISPGPCTPREAGCSVEVVQELWKQIPILGVCLGHQAIGAAFGATVARAPQPWHGRTSQVFHAGQGVFRDVPSPVTVCRYHSLVVDEATLPADIEVVARTSEGIVMGLQHRSEPLVGLQFHPESILTEGGFQMLANFLAMADLAVPQPLPSLEDERSQPVPTSWRYPDQPLTF